MKKIKKFLTLVLACIMVFTSFSVNALAEENSLALEYEKILPSEASPELYSFLEDLSIDTESIIDMKVQFETPITRSVENEANVLTVRTKDEMGERFYIITGLNENENGDLEDAKIVEQSAMTRAATLRWTPSGTNVVQVVTALYAAYMNNGSLADLYYNPYGIQSYYYINSGSYTIQNMYAQLHARGEVFSYPAFTSRGYYTTHLVTTNINNPVSNRTYSSINYFSSGTTQLLRISNSGDSLFQVIVKMTVNGKQETRAYTISAS